MDAPLNKEAFENAIHAWAELATGIQWIWGDQSAPRPTSPYGSIDYLSGPTTLSPSWETRWITDETRDAGEEVEQEICNLARVSFSFQAHVPLQDGRAPGFHARDYLEKLQAATELPSTLALLQAQEISVIRDEGVVDLTAISGATFESRAGLDVVFGVRLSVSEYTGYIEKIHAECTELGIDQDFGVTT